MLVLFINTYLKDENTIVSKRLYDGDGLLLEGRNIWVVPYI